MSLVSMVFFDNIPGGGGGGGKGVFFGGGFFGGGGGGGGGGGQGVFANLDPDIYREMGRLRSEGKLGFVKVQ